VSTGAADVHFKRLQSVQNAAARLVSGARRHDHKNKIPLASSAEESDVQDCDVGVEVS